MAEADRNRILISHKEGMDMKTIAVILCVLLFLGFILFLISSFIFHQFVLRDKVQVPENVKKKKKKNETTSLSEKTRWLKSQPMKTAVIQAQDGVRLVGKLWFSDVKSNRFIIACHGASGLYYEQFCFLAEYYHKNGYNLLLVNNRGCGESGGEFISYGVNESRDLLHWMKYILNNFPTCSIFLHGISMGASSVLMTCDGKLPENIKGIISDCAFTNAWDEFKYKMYHSYHCPAFPVLNIVNLLCRTKAHFSLRDAAPLNHVIKSKVPILFIHGKNDEYVPPRMTQQLYDSCPAPKKLLLVPGAEHANSSSVNPALYEEYLTEFLTREIDRTLF